MHKYIFNFESITYSVKQRENAFAAPLIILKIYTVGNHVTIDVCLNPLWEQPF